MRTINFIFMHYEQALYELANTHPYQSEGGAGEGGDLEGEYEDGEDDEVSY